MWIGTPPPLADGYIHRSALEVQTLAALAPGATVALVPDGLELCGTTQLAVAVASAVDTDLRIWLSAGTRASILSVYAEAAAAVGCAPDKFPAWLRDTDRSWLAVIDVITARAGLPEGLIPSGAAGRVLVAGADVPGAELITVGEFTRRESMAYLMGRLSADPGQRQGAADLVAELGDDPLALAQAAAVILSSELTCREYLEHFTREAGESPSQVTWGLSLEHADVLAPGRAQSLLAMAALLDRDGVPVTVLGTALSDNGGALDAVRQAGLISVDDGLVRMASPALAEVRSATPDGLLKSATLDAADALLAAWPVNDRPEALARAFRSCAAGLRQTAGNLLWEGGCHPVLLRAGQSMEAAGLTGTAADWWAALAATATRVLGLTHPDTVALSERLSAAQLAAGRFADAITAFTEAVSEAYHAHGANSLQSFAARERLAAAHQAMGGLSDAISLYRGVLADRERTQGTKHPDTMTTCFSLAGAHLADERPKVAISLLKRVVPDRERVLGPDHLDTIGARSALAAAYHTSGRMASAVQLYEKARDGYAAVLGPDNRETLNASLRLAHAYYAVGRLGDVTRVLRETLSRSEAAFGPADPLTAAVRESLANVS